MTQTENVDENKNKKDKPKNRDRNQIQQSMKDQDSRSKPNFKEYIVVQKSDISSRTWMSSVVSNHLDLSSMSLQHSQMIL